jgi:tetratricopeptide (TPR) repeat protein
MSIPFDDEIQHLITQALDLLTRYGASSETELPKVKQALLSHIQTMVTKYRQCYDQNQLDSALKLSKVILAASRLLESRGGEAVTLFNQGLIYEKMQRLQDALNSFLQALQIEQEQGNLRSESKSLKRIADLYMKLGQPETALTHFKQLFAVQDMLGDKAGKTATQEIIDIIQEELGQ